MKIEIDIPEGYEVDTENSTKECIKLKKIEKKLPETWKEFCATHPYICGERYIDTYSNISIVKSGVTRNQDIDKNVLPSKELAEAMLALCQLIQLRDCYNDGWIPDWNSGIKYSIVIDINIPGVYNTVTVNHILTFKSKKICNQFFENFRDLIEIAKPLL